MRLHIRLTLSFLLLSLLLVAMGVWVMKQRIDQEFNTAFSNQVSAAKEAVQQRLEREADTLRMRLHDLSTNPVIENWADDVKHGSLDHSVSSRKSRRADAARWLTEGLDALWVFDVQQKRMLLAPHLPAGSGPSKSIQRFLSGTAPRHLFPLETIVRDQHRQDNVLMTVVSKEHKGILLIAGRVMGRQVALDLKIGGLNAFEVTIRDKNGDLVASTLNGTTADTEAYHSDQLMVPSAEKPALTCEVHVSRRALQERIASLTQMALAVIGAALLLALVFGILMARKISEPVQRLAGAASLIAAGQRELDLPPDRKDEIGELIHSFRNMASQLEESEVLLRRAERVAAWQEVARELAHEIKNPLTPVQMSIETIRRAHKRKHERFDELFEESTHTILEEVSRLKGIVSEFSQFARLPQPTTRLCSLNDVAHKCVVLFRNNEHDIGLKVDFADDLPEQPLDPDSITQVIQNLLKNGIQAARLAAVEGEVRITTRCSGATHTELIVEDNGPGISEEDLERVFVPYFSSKSGGMGLGLAIVQRIVTGHNGLINVSSTVGRGTRFIIRLPA